MINVNECSETTSFIIINVNQPCELTHLLLSYFFSLLNPDAIYI